jgi:hypothetical protein
MKINSVQRDIALVQGGSGTRSDISNFRDKNTTGMYENNRMNNAGYCGSFTGKESKAAASLSDKILKSNWFGKFTKYSYDHNIATSSLIALILAGIMRPATIMALPGKKDKDDKIYASGQAVASGIMGFVVSTAITSPFDESIKKIFDGKKFQGPKLKAMEEEISKLTKLKELKKITDAEKSKLKLLNGTRSALNTLVKNIPDWIIGVPRAMLTIALIPPILKYVFGLEKKKKTPQEAPKMDFIDKDVFKNVKGGVQ